MPRMELDFAGRVALVTGAGSGIGSAVARALAAHGAHTVVHCNRSLEGAKEARAAIEADGGSASILAADLTDARETDGLVDQVLAEHGRIDVLVNNAGDLVRRAPVPQMSDEDFQRILDLNLTSVFRICRKVVPAMRAQGGGAIVNLTSIAARTGGAGGSVVYATSKGAVSTFTKGLAKEVAGDNIRVNALSPGVITTPFHDRHTQQAQLQAMVRTIPMGRTGTPQECAGTVLYLASPEMSGYVTGQVIEVNGGQLTP